MLTCATFLLECDTHCLKSKYKYEQKYNFHTKLVCEIPRSFERSSPSNLRTQGSFIHINRGKILERDLVSSDNVAKSAMQKPWVF